MPEQALVAVPYPRTNVMCWGVVCPVHPTRGSQPTNVYREHAEAFAVAVRCGHESHKEESPVMAISYAITAMREMDDAGTITPGGVSWLLGYELGQQRCIYVDAYGGDADKVGDVPAGASDADMFRTGWQTGVDEWARDN